MAVNPKLQEDRRLPTSEWPLLDDFVAPSRAGVLPAEPGALLHPARGPGHLACARSPRPSSTPGPTCRRKCERSVATDPWKIGRIDRAGRRLAVDARHRQHRRRASACGLAPRRALETSGRDLRRARPTSAMTKAIRARRAVDDAVTPRSSLDMKDVVKAQSAYPGHDDRLHRGPDPEPARGRRLQGVGVHPTSRPPRASGPATATASCPVAISRSRRPASPHPCAKQAQTVATAIDGADQGAHRDRRPTATATADGTGGRHPAAAPGPRPGPGSVTSVDDTGQHPAASGETGKDEDKRPARTRPTDTAKTKTRSRWPCLPRWPSRLPLPNGSCRCSLLVIADQRHRGQRCIRLRHLRRRRA